MITTSAAASSHRAPRARPASSHGPDSIEVYCTQHREVGLGTGHSGESQLELASRHQDFAHPSMVAYVLDEPGYGFADLKDAVVEIENFGQMSNIYDGRRLICDCVFCISEMHGKKYFEQVVKEGKTTIKLTSEWYRLKNKSRGVALNRHHSEWIIKLHDSRLIGKKKAPTAEADCDHETPVEHSGV